MASWADAWSKTFEGPGGAERQEKAMPTYNPPNSYGWGQSMRHDPIKRILQRSGYAGTEAEISQGDKDFTDYYAGTSSGASSAPMSSPSYSSGGGGSSGGWGGGWGGGGGGGGGGSGGVTQSQLDWIANLLGKGGPKPLKMAKLKPVAKLQQGKRLQARKVNLPNYKGKFQGGQYATMKKQFNKAVGLDQRTANRAYDALGQSMRSGYSNAFTNPNADYATTGDAGGMDQRAMARMMQNQGVNPEVAAGQMEGAAAADQGFGNLWNVLAANEDRAQTDRLANVRQDRATTNTALDVAALQGRTGINLQRAQALDEFRAKRDDMNYQAQMQETMTNFQNAQEVAQANWQQGNQVAAANWQQRADEYKSRWNMLNQTRQFNANTRNSYQNNSIASLLSLIPNLKEGVDLPKDIRDIIRGGRPAPKKPEKKSPKGKVPESGKQGKGKRTSKGKGK